MEATTGILIHIGEKAKFMTVAGTQSFHSANRSGQKFSTTSGRLLRAMLHCPDISFGHVKGGKVHERVVHALVEEDLGG